MPTEPTEPTETERALIIVGVIEGMKPGAREKLLARSEEMLQLIDDLVAEGRDGPTAQRIKTKVAAFVETDARVRSGLLFAAARTFDMKLGDPGEQPPWGPLPPDPDADPDDVIGAEYEDA